MSFHIGQDVVCIDPIHTLKKDSPYQICGIRVEHCTRMVLVDVGIPQVYNPSQYPKLECSSCTAIVINDGIYWFYGFRFAPLDELADITELTEILENTKPYEVK